MSSTEERVKAIIARHAGVDVVSNDQRLMQDLKLDSLDLFEVGMDIEDEFDREFPDERIQALTTVQSVVDLASEVTA
jgi:acyl carrier protein